MGEAELSAYAVERFGEVAALVHNAVIETVHEAQDAAVRVHAEHGLPERDPYGTALRGHLNRRLLGKLRNVPGIAARKPAGHRARYEFPVIEETGVVLYWWRVPGEGRVPLPEVRLPRVSHLQQHLMTLAPTTVESQMTLDHALMSDKEIDQLFTDEEQFRAQMARVDGRTVTLWVSASPDGLFDFGWGDAELVDAKTGKLTWPRWESLADAAIVAPALHPVGQSGAKADRFDSDVEDDTGFDLSVRTPTEAVVSEQQHTDEQISGSEDR